MKTYRAIRNREIITDKVVTISESTVESAAPVLAGGQSAGALAHGPDIAPGTPGAERVDYGDVVPAAAPPWRPRPPQP